MAERSGDVENSITVEGDQSGLTAQAGRDVHIVFGRRWVDLAVLVAIVTLGVALVVVTLDDRSEPGSAVAATGEQPPPAETTTDARETTPDRTTTSDRPVQKVPSFTEIHSGRMTLGRVDLDADPPRQSPNPTFWGDYLPAVAGDGFAMADLLTSQIPGLGPATLAKWTGRGLPDAAGCLDHVRRFGTNQIALTDNGTYCGTTPAGRTVLIDGLRAEPGYRAYLAEITVWEESGQ